jgi:uncharacterized protein (DUF58 family)
MVSRFALFTLFLMFVVSVALRNSMLFLLDVTLLIIVFTSWLWGRYCLASVSYARRFVADRLFPGEETDFWIEVINAKPLPLTWLRAEDEIPAGLAVVYSNDHVQRRMLTNLFSLRWYERVRRRYRLRGEMRGAYDLDPALVTSGDLFGFRQRRAEIGSRQTVLVYPKIVAIDQLGLPPARPLGDYGADRRIVEDPWRIAGARDYQAGDSVRHLHWKATAHRGLLQTKLFDPSASPHWMVCLNTQTLERLYEGVIVDYLETAIVVAASIAHAGLEARRSVGLTSNSTIRASQHWAYVPASRHAQQNTHILEALAQLTHPPVITFDKMLRSAAPRFPFGASLFIVTPLITDAILDAVWEMRRAAHPLQLIAIGPQPKVTIPPEIPWCFVEQNWTEMQSLKL